MQQLKQIPQSKNCTSTTIHDPKKIRQHYPVIQEALRRFIEEELVAPALAPLIEIAKGMKAASFEGEVSWEDVHSMSPKTLSERLQGVVTREMILDKIQFQNGISQVKQAWLKNWIENADDLKIKQFLFAMTGASSLGRKPLSVEKSDANIHFHTCYNSVDIPMDVIDSEERFVETIEATISGKEYTAR